MAPLNQVPGAVVSLMDRTNVETVIVAGKVRKWKGQLLDVDLPRLRQQLEASRDYIFKAAGFRRTCSAPSKPDGIKRKGAASSRPFFFCVPARLAECVRSSRTTDI